MANSKEARADDQLVSRIIRRAIARYQQAEILEEKLDIVMTMAAVSSVSMMTNRQYIASTLKYIESRLQ